MNIFCCNYDCPTNINEKLTQGMLENHFATKQHYSFYLSDTVCAKYILDFVRIKHR